MDFIDLNDFYLNSVVNNLKDLHINLFLFFKLNLINFLPNYLDFIITYLFNLKLHLIIIIFLLQLNPNLSFLYLNFKFFNLNFNYNFITHN
jgi:hypothetical protein